MCSPDQANAGPSERRSRIHPIARRLQAMAQRVEFLPTRPQPRKITPHDLVVDAHDRLVEVAEKAGGETMFDLEPARVSPAACAMVASFSDSAAFDPRQAFRSPLNIRPNRASRSAGCRCHGICPVDRSASNHAGRCWELGCLYRPLSLPDSVFSSPQYSLPSSTGARRRGTCDSCTLRPCL